MPCGPLCTKKLEKKRKFEQQLYFTICSILGKNKLIFFNVIEMKVSKEGLLVDSLLIFA